MSKQIETLALTAAFIEAGWVQKWYAKDAAGAWVASISPRAVCWCLGGALNAALNGRPIGNSNLVDLLESACKDRGTISIFEFNDDIARSVDDVLAVISDAVDLAASG